MRGVGSRVVLSVVVMAIVAGVAVPLSGQSPPDRAATVLAATQKALGGTDRLNGVRSFVATGRTRQVRGDNLLPIEFQISFEAPDKYMRRDEFPTQDSGPTTTGFNGNALIQDPPQTPAGGRGGPGPAPPSKGGPPNVREDVARLMLGMFAGAVTVLPLTFSYVGIAEAPQGQAEVVQVTSPTGGLARLFVDRATHMPVMVTWSATTQPSGESRLFFADYRDVNGLKWPFRIRRSLGADPIEETNIDGFRVNVKIDPRRFEVSQKP